MQPDTDIQRIETDAELEMIEADALDAACGEGGPVRVPCVICEERPGRVHIRTLGRVCIRCYRTHKHEDVLARRAEQRDQAVQKRSDEESTMARRKKSDLSSDKWQGCPKSKACSRIGPFPHRGMCNGNALIDQVAPALPVNEAGEYEPTEAEHERHVQEAIADGRQAAARSNLAPDGSIWPASALAALDYGRIMGLPAPRANVRRADGMLAIHDHICILFRDDGQVVEVELVAKA
jgi:hypothetical protein